MIGNKITAGGGSGSDADRLTAEHISVHSLDLVGGQDIHGQPVDCNILKG